MGASDGVTWSLAANERRSRTPSRQIGVLSFLLSAFAVWAAMFAALFAVVYFFVADRTPEVLTVREVNIELSDYEITPDVIEVQPSTSLSFLVTNTGDAQHTLTISKDVGTERLKTGESAVLDAGVAVDSYLVWCSVKGHRELGMEARILVEHDE